MVVVPNDFMIIMIWCVILLSREPFGMRIRIHWLEQLRPLLHGIPMGVTLFDGPAARGIDTPADLKWAEAEITRHLREVSP